MGFLDKIKAIFGGGEAPAGDSAAPESEPEPSAETPEEESSA